MNLLQQCIGPILKQSVSRFRVDAMMW